MDFFEFDFRFHTDLSTLARGKGREHHTQYFELAPGPYKRKHWQPGSRFIDEYTFSLIEGPFEEHVPGYDHFSYVEVPSSQWELILGDLQLYAPRSLRLAKPPELNCLTAIP